MKLKDSSILIFAPHPDDEAICTGGLIMKARKENAKVFVCFACVGESRQFGNGKTNSTQRKKELEDAASFGGFEHTLLFEGDEFMRLDSYPQKMLIEHVEDVIEKIKPTIVCIPFRGSFDQDHRAVATACITALRPIPRSLRYQPLYVLEVEEPYSWSTYTNSFNPNLYIDISDTFEEKILLLKMHKTQLREDPFPRSPANIKRLAGLRGAEIGVPYAEAYQLLKGHII